jgi:hypothetical protein
MKFPDYDDNGRVTLGRYYYAPPAAPQAVAPPAPSGCSWQATLPTDPAGVQHTQLSAMASYLWNNYGPFTAKYYNGVLYYMGNQYAMEYYGSYGVIGIWSLNCGGGWW